MMNTKRLQSVVAAVTGLGALLACILACTSFSPDDKKILYPSVDAGSGAMGVAVYDRPSGESQLLFAAQGYSAGGEQSPRLVRSQWLPDGKHVVVTWIGLDDDDKRTDCELAVISLDKTRAVRFLKLAELDPESRYLALRPLPMVGNRLFVPAATNLLLSLNVVSGDLRRHELPEPIMALYFSPMTNRLGFVVEKADEHFECGLLNPDTLAREWQVEARVEGEIGSVAFSPKGKVVAFSPDPENDAPPAITIAEAGKPVRRLPVPVKEEETLHLGDVAFSPGGDWLVAPFALATEETEGQALGFVEVPLDGGDVRRTMLIPHGPMDNEYSARFLSLGVSHDGKTLAAASTYVPAGMGNEGFRLEDCALFIVDLTHPQRPFKKVPIPLPAHRGWLGR